ncbi:MAG: hypothetical protein QME54_03485 [Actinomycetota bacterium]|nr:hypothetical protein [Actinomycetota bacterium]
MKKMDFPDIVKESDIIIKGKVVEILPSVEEKPVIVTSEEDAKKAAEKGETCIFIVSNEKEKEAAKRYSSIIYTDKIIKVEKYLKNPQSKNKIIVREEGGKIGDKEVVVAGITPLKLGDYIILFLKKIPVKNVYFIKGGPQGQYFIQKDLAVCKGIETKKVSELEAEIKDPLK